MKKKSAILFILALSIGLPKTVKAETDIVTKTGLGLVALGGLLIGGTALGKWLFTETEEQALAKAQNKHTRVYNKFANHISYMQHQGYFHYTAQALNEKQLFDIYVSVYQNIDCYNLFSDIEELVKLKTNLINHLKKVNQKLYDNY